MDSLSQALLGAATFAVVKDKHIGKKSLGIGVIAGTIPDLDVLLFPFFNEVAFISVHRSFSHSILFAILGAVAFGYLAHRLSKRRYQYKDWTMAFFLAFLTHSLLDWCTTYGTKMLCPFNGYLFSLNNIHVIEPIYTSILLIGVLVLVIKKMPILSRTKVLAWTLGLSTLYLGWSVVAKVIANHHFMANVQAQNIPYEKVMISPTPLNTLLWNAVIKTADGYYFGSYSLLDSREEIPFYFVESRNDLLPEIKKFKKGRQYLAYTQDFPLVEVEDEVVKIYAIKFGPINYFGTPQFVYPLCMNLKEAAEENFKIEYSAQQRGPIKNYKNLFKRIKGI